MDSPPQPAISGAELARELETSIPRVTRAAERLGIAREASGRLALTPDQAGRLRDELGFVPAIDGLSRSEVIVLAALRSAPLGLASKRAVARRSGLSPTAAANVLDTLLEKRLVTRRDEMIAAGRARQMTVWRANLTHPRWRELAPLLGEVRPVGSHSPSRDTRVPRRLHHLFWNTAPEQLEVASSGSYVARRLLRSMDLQGLAWGAKNLRPEDWLAGAKARGLEPSVRQLAKNLAAGAKG